MVPVREIVPDDVLALLIVLVPVLADNILAEIVSVFVLALTRFRSDAREMTPLIVSPLEVET